MRYILQTIDGKMEHDFVRLVEEAIKYSRWLYGETDREVEYKEGLDFKGIKEGIPVGTVEFVESYYKTKDVELKPYNVPKELYAYAKRYIWNGTEKDTILTDTFYKSNDKVKGNLGVVKAGERLPNGNYQYSELLEIDSEWRCFIKSGELISIHPYMNSIGLQPDLECIRQIAREYKKLEDYSFDIGVNESEGTFIIEVHDYYSVGLYGFNDYLSHLRMLEQSHKARIRRGW